MILEIFLLAIGLVILSICADMLIIAAVKLADKLKISKLVISLTVVALGTSIPETIVSTLSALKGSSIAFSNVVGSNICNIALILGVSLFIDKIVINKKMEKEITKMMIIKTIFVILCVISFVLTKVSGIIMLLCLLLYILNLAKVSKNDEEFEDADDEEEWIYNVATKIFKNETVIIIVFLALGIFGLYEGGNLVVDSAIEIATRIGINEGIIGASLVAIGTSLPELITAISAMKKKEYEIVIGNIVGSNIINILLILGISSIITNIPIGNFEIIQLACLIFTSFLFFLFVKKDKTLTKFHGICLLATYALSMIVIYFA